MLRIVICLTALVLALSGSPAGATTITYPQIDVGPHSYLHAAADATRGLWFVSPTDFIIRGISVPTDASTEAMSVEVLRLHEMPGATPTTNFTNLGYWGGLDGTLIIPTFIPVHLGDIIGVFGVRGAAGPGATVYTSFAPSNPYPTSVLDIPMDLGQLRFNGNLRDGEATSVYAGANWVGRVNVYYSPTPEPAVAWLIAPALAFGLWWRRRG